MQKDFCDICSREIVVKDDIRYVNISRIEKEKDKLIMPEKEICIWCSEDIKKYITWMGERREKFGNVIGAYAV